MGCLTLFVQAMQPISNSHPTIHDSIIVMKNLADWGVHELNITRMSMTTEVSTTFQALFASGKSTKPISISGHSQPSNDMKSGDTQQKIFLHDKLDFRRTRFNFLNASVYRLSVNFPRPVVVGKLLAVRHVKEISSLEFRLVNIRHTVRHIRFQLQDKQCSLA